MDQIEWLCGNVTLLEEGKIGNYSSFPHAKEMWSDLETYLNNYILQNAPEENSIYGKYYVIQIPNDFTKYRFWKNLKLTIHLVFDGTYQKKPIMINGYQKIDDNDTNAIEYIKNNNEFETLTVYLSDIVTEDKIISDSLFLNFMHEFLHAYEDIQRIKKGNKTLSNYGNSTNYNDYFEKRLRTPKDYQREVNCLCTLFHFLNKSEIRALISQLSGEIQKTNDINSLTIEKIISNSNSWKEIEMAEHCVDVISNYNEPIGQQELVKTFNNHSIRKKVKNFNELVSFLESKTFNVKQYIFKKISKIIGDMGRDFLTRKS